VVVFLLQLLYLWRKTPGFFTRTKASLYLVMMRKISTPLRNDILGAHVVGEPILCDGGSGGHEDRMAKYKIMMEKKRSADKANLQDQDSYVCFMIFKHKF
jgi:hypothetical protein